MGRGEWGKSHERRKSRAAVQNGRFGSSGIQVDGLASRGGRYFFCPAARASRFAFAQPSFTICLDRPRARALCGTLSVMQDAAPTYDPLPSVTGATSVESLPTK